MTEASGGGRAELECRLIEKSLQDESLRQRLLADPRAALEEELGTRLPENIEVSVVEETADTVYLVLPSASPVGEVGELSDQGLTARERTLYPPNSTFRWMCLYPVSRYPRQGKPMEGESRWES